MRWFRFYDEAMDDPKVQQLPAALFRTWVNLLCLASKNRGALPKLKDIAFALRLSESKASEQVVTLTASGLIDNVDGMLRPHNWNGRQFTSDDSSNRVKAFRERHRNDDVTATVTPPDTDTDTDTEQNREEKGGARVSARSPTHDMGSWELDDGGKAIIEAENLSPDVVVAAIRDWAVNAPASKRRKKDPHAFLRNWCRRQHEMRRGPPNVVPLDVDKALAGGTR